MGGFAGEFLDLCTMTIVWQPLTGRDQYGAPIWGPPQTFPGRREAKSQRVAAYERGTKGQGAEVISEAEILILAIPFAPGIQYEDAVYVSGDRPPYPPILSVGTVPDETGTVYVKVMLGSSNG